MKLFKLTLLTLMIAIITTSISTYAKFDIYVYQEISVGKTNKTPTYAKDDASNQTYTNSTTATALTNPCPNCKILVKGYSQNYGTTSGVITQMGSTYYMANSGYIDNYYLKLNRYDTTALKTITAGTWHIETN